ncbi:MAG: TraR/DksA C4-type zinc finger protein [Patescibacteria group bacterium]
MSEKHYKEQLEKEKKMLEKRLSGIAQPNPDIPGDWQTKPEDLNVLVSDPNELADIFEESANKEALEVEIEDRLNKVKAALQRIKNGTFGKCKEGCEIEEKRLRVNPAAETCIKHSRNA